MVMSLSQFRADLYLKPRITGSLKIIDSIFTEEKYIKKLYGKDINQIMIEFIII